MYRKYIKKYSLGVIIIVYCNIFRIKFVLSKHYKMYNLIIVR